MIGVATGASHSLGLTSDLRTFHPVTAERFGARPDIAAFGSDALLRTGAVAGARGGAGSSGAADGRGASSGCVVW